MAKITRKQLKIFAGDAANNGQFGSAKVGTKIESNDPDTIQALAAYDGGWEEAVISSDQLPPLEEMQGLQYLFSYHIAYILQEGVAEWNSQTDYYTNSLVKFAGTTQFYASITDNNINNLPTDVSNWAFCYDAKKVAYSDNDESVDNEIAVFDGTEGRKIKRTSFSGILKAASGVLSAVSQVSIAAGGTGQSNAASAFNALKQAATTAVSGVLEIATNAEMKTGSATDKALVPSNYGGQQSKATKGYQVLPGGITLQWGTISGALLNQAFISETFALTFPNACLNVTGSIHRSTTVTGTVSLVFRNDTVSGFQVAGDQDTTVSTGDIHWFAVGY